MVIKLERLLGTQSPLTGKSIGLALINREAFEMGKEVLVQVRKRQVKAKLLRKIK